MPTDAGRRAGREQTRGVVVYRRAVAAVVVALVVVGGGLGAWSATQGPRLRSVATDATTLVTAAAPQIVFTADQPLASDVHVQIDPASAVDAVVDGSRITLRFAAPLDYDVAYRITADVTSAETGRSGALSTSVSTPDASVYLLQRTPSGGSQEQLLRVALRGGGDPVSVFSARRIDSYVSYGGQFAVLSSDGSADSLQVVEDGASRTVDLPSGAHADLRRSDLGRLGWLQKSGTRPDGSAYASNLFVDGQTPGDPPHEVTGFSGAPLSVADWRFVPGTDSVVVQDFDQQVYVIDTRTVANPTPLGRFGVMTGFLPGSTSLVIRGSDPTLTVIDLATGNKRLITPPAAAPPAGEYAGVSVLRDESSALAQWNAADAGAVGGQRSSTIVLADGAGVHPVVAPSGDGSWIDRYCLSPNGRYLSVQLVGAEGRVLSGGLPTMFSHTHVEFIDIASGQVVRTVPDAADFDWCT